MKNVILKQKFNVEYVKWNLNSKIIYKDMKRTKFVKKSKFVKKTPIYNKIKLNSVQIVVNQLQNNLLYIGILCTTNFTKPESIVSKKEDYP